MCPLESSHEETVCLLKERDTSWAKFPFLFKRPTRSVFLSFMTAVYKRRFHGKESSAQRSDPWAGLIASCGSFGLMVCNRRTRIQLTRIVNFFGHMPGKCANQDRASGFFLSLFCSRSTSSISWFTLSGIWNSLVKISSLSWSSVRERPFFLAFGLLMSRKKEIRVALLDQRQIIFTIMTVPTFPFLSFIFFSLTNEFVNRKWKDKRKRTVM